MAIVKRALVAPLEQIAVNAGLKVRCSPRSRVAEGAGRAPTIRTSASRWNGGELVDLLAEGIIDPLKVTRAALQNAASVAALLLHHRGNRRRDPAARSADAGGPADGRLLKISGIVYLLGQQWQSRSRRSCCPSRTPQSRSPG